MCGFGNYSAQIGKYTFNRECKFCPNGTVSVTTTAYNCTQCRQGRPNVGKGNVDCVGNAAYTHNEIQPDF